MNEHVRTIEIEGQKFEIDTRTAKKIEVFRVGDKVRLLTKSYSGFETHPAVIVGIDAFKNLPTVVVAYIDNILSSGGEIKIAYINSQSKDTELCPMCEDDLLPTQATILAYFNQAIEKKQGEMEGIVAQKEYFLRMYGTVVGTAAEDINVESQAHRPPPLLS